MSYCIDNPSRTSGQRKPSLARTIADGIDELKRENEKLRKMLRNFMEDEVIERELRDFRWLTSG